jgi:hypothetical protein
MGKSHFKETEEQRGSLPAMTGALLEIVEIERAKTKEKGLRMYVVELKVVEPKEFANSTVRDWIVVGTEDDPLAKQPQTWARSEAGPGRLKRLLTRSGTALSDDDEEWMEAAAGNQVVAPISARADDSGEIRNRPGLYFRPSDEDCPEIGEATEESGKGKSKGSSAKGAAAASKKARGRHAADEAEDEDEKPKTSKKAKDADDEDEEDEKPSKSKKKKDDDDEDEDD